MTIRPFYFVIVVLVIFGLFAGSYNLGIMYGKNHAGKACAVKEQKGVIDWMMANSDLPESTLHEVYKLAMTTEFPDLILAIIKTESNFNPYVKSSPGAKGLMGVMPKYWADELKKKGIIKSTRDLYDMQTNINAGVYILKYYFETYKDINVALIKYSGGAKKYANSVFVSLGEINYAKMRGTW
jgi:hypothetical protein